MGIWTNIKDSLIRPAKDKKNMNRIGMTLSNNYVLPFLVILIDLVLFFLFNYIVNTCFALSRALTLGLNFNECFQIINVIPDWSIITGSYTLKVIYIAFAVCLVLLDITYVYRMKMSLSDDFFNAGQKGDTHFKTIDEIRKQYKEIPDKGSRFPGRGGTIISRYGNKLYIDDSIVNNLIIGMTRSGKDEFYVFPSIDIYSRAEMQSSMIILDPKTESYRSSKKTLEKRGYQVYFMNLDQPIYSMNFNPLLLIKEYYKKGYYDDAEMLSDAFAYSIYTPDTSKMAGNEKFFAECAASILSGLVLSQIKDCLEEDAKLNETNFTLFRKKQSAYKKLSVEEQQTAKEHYYRIVSQGYDPISNEETNYIPDDIDISSVSIIDKYEKCITMYSIINTVVELSEIADIETGTTFLDVYFANRPALDAGKIRYSSAMVAGDRTKGSILSTLINGLDVFKNRAIAKMTAESTLDFDDIGFGNKPIAVFLGIPDYDRSKWFLATVFIRQAYYYLAQKCARMNGKCPRPVKFICNEFGNMPPIDDMAGAVTVCCGRNISFDMYIQSYSQLAEKYGEKTQETIESNCGNIIYLLTSSKETSEKISELIGHRTRKIMQRSGDKLGLDKHFIESLEQDPLIYPEDLRRLKEGECIIIPSMHRKDLQGHDIKEDPIFNSVESGTRFLYRYQYLADDFPDPDTIDLGDINTFNCSLINPDERVWDPHLSLTKYSKKEVTFGDLNLETQKQIIELVRNALEDEFNPDLFLPNVSLHKILSVIVPCAINEYVKSTIVDLILMAQERKNNA